MNQIWPKITLDTSIEELKDIHKRIWDKCIDEYDGKHKPISPYRAGCVACEVATLRFKENPNESLSICHYCPLFDITECCTRHDSLYFMWAIARNKKIAQQIRDHEWLL